MAPPTDERGTSDTVESARNAASAPATGGAATGLRPAPGGPALPPAPPPGSAHPASSLFDSAFDRSVDLFRGNREVLRESYVPARLPHREHQIQQVAEILAPALRGNLPSNLLLYGKIGTGKTAVVAQVLSEIARRAAPDDRIHIIRINCGSIDTAYSLLQTIGNHFARDEIDRIPTGWSLDRVQSAMTRLLDAQGGILLLALDEIDRLVDRSGDGVLYTLSQINAELNAARVALLGISNNLKFTSHLDGRVRSRLNEEKIVFPPYDAVQLQDILRERAKEAFREGVVDGGVIERCAAYAALENGDARRAIALLRLAAEMAERDRAKRITTDHVVKAKNRLEQDIIGDCCRTLPSHCKVLLFGILQLYERNRQGVLTGDVYAAYSKLCQRLGLQPLHTRSISNHLVELETLGLIRATIVSRGRGGRSREIVVDVPIQETIPFLEEDPLLAPIARPRGRGQMLLTNFDNPSRFGGRA
ncbi:MAG: orc1/cdc6 family replication initiation protein [Thermoplasmata archaeon]